jgi:UDP-N-acetylmuramoyl-tripeptide--D-alanyl-D-alanine ligase
MLLKNLIYILQSENYYFFRFLKFVYSHFNWWNLQKIKKITWTSKALALWTISAFVILVLVFAMFILGGLLKAIILTLLIIPFLPLIIGISLAILYPADFWLKKRIFSRAGKIIKHKKATVIGITGSYGKTSAKEILAVMLEKKYPVIKTPENVNTDIGIAEFIINNSSKFDEQTVFIVEMGAYKIGEIARTAEIVKPKFSILTGINESHLERFGSLKNIIQGKFELPERTEELAVLNLDDRTIEENYRRFNIKKMIGVSQVEAKNVLVKSDFQGLEFEWRGEKFETQLLAEHNITAILLCASIAQELGIGMDEITDAVKMIVPVAHRLQPIFNSYTGITVIDDSYNGNINGIRSGIDVLQRARGRKVVLTPGLVELGEKSREIHSEIGKLYTQKVDLVLLIDSPGAKHIERAMKSLDFKNYKVYNNTKEAHEDLANILKNGDTIIFQNDLTDNYF